MVYLLDETIWFPETDLAEPDGLLAVGGDLSAERLILAYSQGIFPWFSEGEPILWFCPHERCVIYPEKLKISKSLTQVLKSNKFKVTWNTAFEQVIENCKNIYRPDQEGTWITEDMQNAYAKLHRLGLAQSLEVWENTELVGGLYGIVKDKVFCGESMFSKVSNASKTAMVHLCRNASFQLIDCQVPNDHLLSLGAEMISYEKYRLILDN